MAEYVVTTIVKCFVPVKLKTDESAKKAGAARGHHSYPYDGHQSIEYVHTNIPAQRNAAKFLRSLMVT